MVANIKTIAAVVAVEVEVTIEVAEEVAKVASLRDLKSGSQLPSLAVSACS